MGGFDAAVRREGRVADGEGDLDKLSQGAKPGLGGVLPGEGQCRDRRDPRVPQGER